LTDAKLKQFLPWRSNNLQFWQNWHFMICSLCDVFYQSGKWHRTTTSWATMNHQLTTICWWHLHLYMLQCNILKIIWKKYHFYILKEIHIIFTCTSFKENHDDISFIHDGFCNRSNATVPLVEQELPTHPEHPSSPSFFCGFMFFNLLFSVLCFVDHCLSFVLSLLDIVLPVLWFTVSDYTFDIFKHFFHPCQILI
jgi:hypothetical protein